MHQRVTYAFSFVQMMCDLNACHTLVKAHEQRVNRPFLTVARLRLDLAWETPLVMPSEVLPNVVYTSRMNAKAGINDKWALGRRATMAAYLERVALIPVANALFNKSSPPIGVRASSRVSGFLLYECPPFSVNKRFTCRPRRSTQTDWQWWAKSANEQQQQEAAQPSADSRVQREQHRFALTSEGFLHWALWRANISIGFEPSWMFCKFGNAVNTTARICVPRMRKRCSCVSLVCPGGLTDCGCRNTTCDTGKSPLWYCEDVRGKQMLLDPYQSGGSPVF